MYFFSKNDNQRGTSYTWTVVKVGRSPISSSFEIYGEDNQVVSCDQLDVLFFLNPLDEM